MIQMLIVLFSVYTKFGSRLLLQTNNAWVPINPGVEPIPPFVNPYVPAEPQAPVDPVPAVPDGPVVPAVPVVPDVPVVPTVPQTPQYVPIDPAQTTTRSTSNHTKRITSSGANQDRMNRNT
eukprot:85977_1